MGERLSPKQAREQELYAKEFGQERLERQKAAATSHYRCCGNRKVDGHHRMCSRRFSDASP